MLRFAVSPTEDMHLNSLRVALLNYIVSKQRGEEFIVRMQDLDKEKNIEGKDQEILDTLALFGIEYSQVIHQSQHVRFHSAMALQLVHEREAFSCFCSDNWLEKKHIEAKNQKKEYSYDDACRNLPAELVIDNTSPFRVRVIRPTGDTLLHDVVQGDVKFTSDAIDSFVILNQDKTPTQNFASGVDDMLSDISFVVADVEDRTNTAKQNHVRDALKYEKKLEFAHVPALKDGNVSVKTLLEQGFLPEAILNYLILIQDKVPEKILTLSEAIEWFDISKVSSKTIAFDIETLKAVNKKQMQALDPKELSRYVGFADAEIGELARVYLADVSTTRELKSKIAPVFQTREIPDTLTKQAQMVKDIIMKAPYFDEYTAFESYVKKESELEGEEFLQVLRILLTNASDGPALDDIYKYLKNYIGEIVK